VTGEMEAHGGMCPGTLLLGKDDSFRCLQGSVMEWRAPGAAQAPRACGTAVT